MNCYGCPYSEENKACPCVEKTVDDIKRIGYKKELQKKRDEDFYFRMSITRSRRLGDR